MKLRMLRIEGLNLHLDKSVFLGLTLLFSSCVMTKKEGALLFNRMTHLEKEMAKLESVKHDLEVLLSSKVLDLYERISRVENILGTIQESVFEGSKESSKVVLELQALREELEKAKEKYVDLEKLKEKLKEDNKKLSQIPPLKNEHLALAKKYFENQKIDEAIFLFEAFIKQYENDKTLTAKSYYYLGDLFGKKSDLEKNNDQKLIHKKKAIVYLQKTIENSEEKNDREEALFKMGLLLESIGNKPAAKAAFMGLLEENSKSKRAKAAKEHLAGLKEDDSE